jgi:hypothetical protein
MGIAAIAVAMTRHSVATSTIVATTQETRRITVISGGARNTMRDGIRVALARTVPSTGAIAFRPNIATGTM